MKSNSKYPSVGENLYPNFEKVGTRKLFFSQTLWSLNDNLDVKPSDSVGVEQICSSYPILLGQHSFFNSETRTFWLSFLKKCAKLF